MRAKEFITEAEQVTFAGKDPSEFTSPNGGKAAMVIQTAQGSRYLITTDGMVLRHKSFHANTGGEDQGVKDWMQHIEFYEPTKIGGTTFPLIVSKAVEKRLPVALSTTQDGKRVLLIAVDGKWRAAKISDIFKSVGTGGDASVIATYSTTPKLNWDPMDYNMNNNGTLLKVHPGSPVTHGIKV